MEVSEELTSMIVLPIFFGLLAWFLKMVYDWKKIKLKSDFHHKLVEKFGNVEELNKFLQTDSGVSFLKSLTINGSLAPKEKLIGAISKGVIFGFLGIAAFVLGLMFKESSRYLFASGIIIFSLGIGFFVSSAIAYNLSKKWGIIDEV